jgi:hypothetical protein
MFRYLVLAASLFASSPALAEAATIPETAAVADHRAQWDTYLRARRAAQLERLDAYARAGAFPRDPTSSGFSHQFRDANGNLCAVANLIWQDGFQDLVLETQQHDNDVVIAEIDGPSRLLGWVTTSGLTLEEVAIVQEPEWDGPQPPIDAKLVARQERERRRAEAAEVERIRDHLATVADVLAADEDSAIDTQLRRLEALGALASPPPGF